MRQSILNFGMICLLLSGTGAINESFAQHDEHMAEEGLHLNNGEKWVANPETTTGVKNMKAMMDAFTDKENAEAFVALAEEMRGEFQLIFQNCTMTGEAHEQLHHFLVPIRIMLMGVSSGELKARQDTFGQLRKHLDTYDTYFK